METNGTAIEKAKTSMVMAKVKNQGNLAGLKPSEMREFLEPLKPQMLQALPTLLKPDRIIQMVVKIASSNPAIAQCSTESFIAAIMSASILGFKPVAELGECYFVPYGKVLQFQIGYRGYVTLARRSGQIKSLYAEVVRKGDVFHYEQGLERVLKHIPKLDAEGEMTHVYAVVHYNDGGFDFIVRTKKQIEALRKRNSSQKNGVTGAWATDYEAMAKAKAVKQLAKLMPLSDEEVQKPDGTTEYKETKFQTALRADEGVLSFQSFANDQSGTLETVEFPQLTEEVATGNSVADELSEAGHDYGK